MIINNRSPTNRIEESSQLGNAYDEYDRLYEEACQLHASTLVFATYWCACVRTCMRACVRARACVCVLELASVSRLCDMFDIDSYEKLPPCSGEGRIPITL